MCGKEIATTAQNYAESIINTVREPLIVLDPDLRVVSASHSFYKIFKVKPEETVGQLIYDLGNKRWDIPKLLELLETILPRKTSFDDNEVEHDFATSGGIDGVRGVSRRFFLGLQSRPSLCRFRSNRQTATG